MANIQLLSEFVNSFPELWLPVKGFEGFYLISNRGRVISLKNLGNRRPNRWNTIDRILSLDNTTTGYKQVVLCNGKIRTQKRIHQIVLSSFKENPLSKPNVNHINGITDDNRLDNLEWCTQSENMYHAHRSGLINQKSVRGANHTYCTHTEDQVRKIKLLLKLGYAIAKISKTEGFTRDYVKAIKYGYCWKWLEV